MKLTNDMENVENSKPQASEELDLKANERDLLIF